jgi:hypothetical protein
MQLTEPIICPFCGQRFDLLIDTTAGSHRFTSDCEICCHPLEIHVECEPGNITNLHVASE